jgi:hypothetical protein
MQVRPWSNPWLALATCVSLGLHCVILYVPFLAQVRVLMLLFFKINGLEVTLMWCDYKGYNVLADQVA